MDAYGINRQLIHRVNIPESASVFRLYPAI